MGATELLSVPYALYAANGGVGGTTGATGQTGPTGTNGAQGEPGPTGATGGSGSGGGPTGPPGSTGPTGVIGPVGITGTNWAATTPSASGANTALSNLVATSVNQSLIPQAFGTYDIGSTSYPWKDVWLSGRIIMNISASVGGLNVNHTGGGGIPIQATINGTTNSSNCIQ